MKRMGMAIYLHPDKIDEYKKLHQAVWPEILALLTQYHIRRYSIFLKDNLLFSYFEYHGEDYAADMQHIANHETTKRWWALTAPCQKPLSTRAPNEWWTAMEEVFYLE